MNEIAKRKIIYVYNPISGTKAKNVLLKTIAKATKEKNLHFEFVTADVKGNYEALQKKIKQEKITDVVIIGGDGTINQVTGALRNCNIKFGIIPAGSGNGLAYTAGIPKNIHRALQILFNETPKKTDAFFINNYYACGIYVGAESWTPSNWYHFGSLPGTQALIFKTSTGWSVAFVINTRFTNANTSQNAFAQMLIDIVTDNSIPWQDIDQF